MNEVLKRLLQARKDQEAFISALLERVEAENRDLVEAELGNLQATRERITELDAQIEPLEAFEATRAAHRDSIVTHEDTTGGGNAGGTRRLTITPPAAHEYRTAGEFLVDVAATHPRQGASPDPAAVARIQSVTRAVGDNTTADAAGILPTPIVGQILNDMDAMRPLIQTLGARDLAGIPGKTFDRPKVTRGAAAGTGIQSAELAVGDSLEVTISGIPFTKTTFLRWMKVSRQEIDWTSPAAWDILMGELIAINAEDTETWAVGVLDTVTQATAVETDDVAGWVTALYAARSQVTTADGAAKARVRRLPDTIFTSLDMDGHLGAMIDIQLASNTNAIGSASLGSFGGDLVKTPRVMLPDLPAGTVIYGRKAGIEFYEERLGLLQAINPQVLGLDVAYGGYCAAGLVDATLFSKLTYTAI